MSLADAYVQLRRRHERAALCKLSLPGESRGFQMAVATKPEFRRAPIAEAHTAPLCAKLCRHAFIAKHSRS